MCLFKKVPAVSVRRGASSQFTPFLQEVQLFPGVAAIYHFDMHFALAQVPLVKLMEQGAYICATSMTIETSGLHAKLHQQHFSIPCEYPRTMLCNKIDKWFKENARYDQLASFVLEKSYEK